MMKIAAHLGVMDEIELIDAVIDHLVEIGVDHVVAFDMGSTDGTLAALERRVGPAFDLVRLRNDTPWAQLQALTVESVCATGADWVLFIDGDEFWLPASGSLRPWLASVAADVISVDRYNVALGPDGLRLPLPPGPSRYADTWLHVRKFDDWRGHMLAHPETPWISGVPVPKVVARVECIGTVQMGGHDVVGASGQMPRRVRATEAIVAHVPYTTPARFSRRLANIAEFLALSPDYLHGTQGWHWRRLGEIARAGGGDAEFARQITTDAQLTALHAAGEVRTAAELLGLA